MEWKKPELICIATKDLLCKVKARANSLPSCVKAYAEETACPELDTGATWGDGEGVTDMHCGILSECVEVGPLFGCYDTQYCSTLVTIL